MPGPQSRTGRGGAQDHRAPAIRCLRCRRGHVHARADLVDLASRAGPVATRALQERVRSLQKQFLHTRAMQVEQTRVRLAFATKQKTGVRWAFSGDECAGSAAASEGQVLRLNRKRRSKGSQRDWSLGSKPNEKRRAIFIARRFHVLLAGRRDSNYRRESPVNRQPSSATSFSTPTNTPELSA